MDKILLVAAIPLLAIKIFFMGRFPPLDLTYSSIDVVDEDDEDTASSSTVANKAEDEAVEETNWDWEWDWGCKVIAAGEKLFVDIPFGTNARFPLVVKEEVRAIAAAKLAAAKAYPFPLRKGSNIVTILIFMFRRKG